MNTVYIHRINNVKVVESIVEHLQNEGFHPYNGKGYNYNSGRILCISKENNTYWVPWDPTVELGTSDTFTFNGETKSYLQENISIEDAFKIKRDSFNINGAVFIKRYDGYLITANGESQYLSIAELKEFVKFCCQAKSFGNYILRGTKFAMGCFEFDKEDITTLDELLKGQE